ncbi:MAG: CBS domain-containing protein [Acidilobaceae archaeon]
MGVARVSTYMSSPVHVVHPTDTLAYARNLLLEKGVSRLVVVDDDEKPVGVLTLSDIARVIMLGSERELDEILVREVMSKPPVVIEESKTLKTAARLMLKHKIGGLPVVDEEGALVGIVTRTDLVRAFADRYEGRYTVRDLMRKSFPVLRRSHSIYYAAKLIEADISGKAVVLDEEGRPVGVVTRRDIAFLDLSLLSRRGKESYRKVKARHPARGELSPARLYLVPLVEDVMSSDVVTTKPSADAAEAARVMLEHGIGCLPVVDEAGRAIGLLTKIEILYAIAL